MIEHVPDFISHLQQCQTILKPSGILSLVIPDKRYCFDYFSPISSTGNVLDAYAEKRTRPSHGQIFDHFAGATKLQDNIAWGYGEKGEAFNLIHSFSQAKDMYNQSLQTSDYIDGHCWRFTPASFRILIADLSALGLINLEIKAEFDTTGCEFHVSLGKKVEGKGENVSQELDRLPLLKDRHKEFI